MDSQQDDAKASWASEVQSFAYDINDDLAKALDELDHSMAHESDIKRELDRAEDGLVEALEAVRAATNAIRELESRSDNAYDRVSAAQDTGSLVGEAAVELQDVPEDDPSPDSTANVFINGVEHRIEVTRLAGDDTTTE